MHVRQRRRYHQRTKTMTEIIDQHRRRFLKRRVAPGLASRQNYFAEARLRSVSTWLSGPLGHFPDGIHRPE